MIDLKSVNNKLEVFLETLKEKDAKQKKKAKEIREKRKVNEKGLEAEYGATWRLTISCLMAIGSNDKFGTGYDIQYHSVRPYLLLRVNEKYYVKIIQVSESEWEWKYYRENIHSLLSNYPISNDSEETLTILTELTLNMDNIISKIERFIDEEINKLGKDTKEEQ